MAIATVTQGASNQNPNGSSQTLGFNSGTTGTNRWLFVSVTMPSTVNFSSATYNGVSMTLIQNSFYSSLSQRQAFYILENPATGTNNIVINFSGSQFSNTSIYAVCVSGCGGYGNFGSNDASGTPHSQSLSVSTGSVVYLTGISNTAQSSNYTIDGVSEATEFQGHNTNKIVEGALSAPIVSGGSITCTSTCDSGDVSNHRVELIESGGGGGSRRIIVV